MIRHFIDLFDLTAETARELIDRAVALKGQDQQGKRPPYLAGRTLAAQPRAGRVRRYTAGLIGPSARLVSNQTPMCRPEAGTVRRPSSTRVRCPQEVRREASTSTHCDTVVLRRSAGKGERARRAGKRTMRPRSSSHSFRRSASMPLRRVTTGVCANIGCSSCAARRL